MEVWTDQPFNLYKAAGQTMTLKAQVVNGSAAARKVTLTWWARDFGGKKIMRRHARQEPRGGRRLGRLLSRDLAVAEHRVHRGGGGQRQRQRAGPHQSERAPGVHVQGGQGVDVRPRQLPVAAQARQGRRTRPGQDARHQVDPDRLRGRTGHRHRDAGRERHRAQRGAVRHSRGRQCGADRGLGRHERRQGPGRRGRVLRGEQRGQPAVDVGPRRRRLRPGRAAPGHHAPGRGGLADEGHERRSGRHGLRLDEELP